MTEEQAIGRAFNHDRPDHYSSWSDDLEVLCTVADDEIDRVFDELNGKV